VELFLIQTTLQCCVKYAILSVNHLLEPDKVRSHLQNNTALSNVYTLHLKEQKRGGKLPVQVLISSQQKLLWGSFATFQRQHQQNLVIGSGGYDTHWRMGFMLAFN